MQEKPPQLEITFRAVMLSIVLAAVLAGANAYLCLFAGTTLSASIPAAVLAMAILRLFRGSTVLENNIVQTAASAGEALAGGVIFTIPALVITQSWTEFHYLQTTIIACLGGLLGVFFSIPLRRAFILESPLRFPEGVATAEVLKIGRNRGDSRFLVIAATVGALFKFGETGLRLWVPTLHVTQRIDRSVFCVGSNLSPALLAVGYIVGAKVAVLVVAGGLLNWLVALPIIATLVDWPVYQDLTGLTPHWALFAADAAHPVGQPVAELDWAFRIWAQQTRYLGVGAMATGGLWALVKLRKSLVAGIQAGIRAFQMRKQKQDVPVFERDMPLPWVGLILLLSIVPLTAVFYWATQVIWLSALMAVVMLIASFLFSAVAAYMAGLVGSANNPISGITMATLLGSAFLLMIFLGKDSAIGTTAAILIGAVVSCAAAVAGDTMQDLKAGHLVGATPYKQQIMQSIGVVAASLVMAPILMLLLKAYGIGVPTAEHPMPLKAPQPMLVAAVARGVFHGGIPWNIVAIGAALAVLIIVLDSWLEKKQCEFRTPVLAVAVGLYLPIELSLPIFLGGLVQLAGSHFSQRKNQPNRPDRTGLLLAAGLITGEALVGIGMAIPIVFAENTQIFAVWGVSSRAWPGAILFMILVVAFLVTTIKRQPLAVRGNND